MLIKSTTQFPRQALSDKQKKEMYGSVKAWARACLNSVIAYSQMNKVLTDNTVYDERFWMSSMYNMYHGNFSQDEYGYITHNLGTNYEFAAKLRNYNIVKPMVDLLLGEEINRAFSFMCYAVNDEHIDMKLSIESNMKMAKAMEEMAGHWKSLGVDIQVDISKIQEEYNYFKERGEDNK